MLIFYHTTLIEDKGPGIPDEMKNMNLQPFFMFHKWTQKMGWRRIMNEFCESALQIISIDPL